MSIPEPLTASLDIADSKSLDVQVATNEGSLVAVLNQLEEVWSRDTARTIRIEGVLNYHKTSVVTYFTPVNQVEPGRGGHLCIVRPTTGELMCLRRMIGCLVKVHYELTEGQRYISLFRLKELEEVSPDIWKVVFQQAHAFSDGEKWEDLTIKSPDKEYYMMPGVVGVDPPKWDDNASKNKARHALKRRLDVAEEKMEAMKDLMVALMDLPEGSGGIASTAAKRVKQSFNKKRNMLAELKKKQQEEKDDEKKEAESEEEESSDGEE